MRLLRGLSGFFRQAPLWMRVRVAASAALAVVALVAFASGHPVIGVIAAGLYVLDVAVIGPGIRIWMTRRTARPDERRR